MFSHWVIRLLVLTGFAYVSGNYCDPATASVCYEDLLHYETLAFPLYGVDGAKLEDTCGHINTSFDCLEQFIYSCSDEAAQCDQDCQELMKLSNHFIQHSGLRSLEQTLCDPTSALRAIYLENAKCLQNNADSYASCHNDSQKSQHYLSTQPQDIESRCCFFKWHGECFKNVTTDHCGENATFFVSFANHNLMGHIADQICYGVQSNCTRPPLPSRDENDIDDTDEIDNDIDDSGNALDNKRKDLTDNDIHNEIDTNKAAILNSYAMNWIMLPFLYIVLSKCIL